MSSIDDLTRGIDRSTATVGPAAESTSSLKADLPRELVFVFIQRYG